MQICSTNTIRIVNGEKYINGVSMTPCDGSDFTWQMDLFGHYFHCKF